MFDQIQDRLVRFLRWSEKYTKTDMVYLVKTGLWVNLSLVISTILGLLLSIVFANFVSPETYGLYQYLIAIAGLVSAVSLSGMNSAVSQAVARGYEGVLKTAVRVQLKWSIIPSILSLIGGIYYFAHGTIELGVGLLAIALFTPFINAFNTYAAFLGGKREFRREFYFLTSINASYYLGMFLVALFVKDAAVFIIANLGINAIGMGFAYWKTCAIYKPNNAIDPDTINYGRHLSVLSAFGTILTQLDSILVFHFLGAAQLAIYSFSTLLPERAASLFNFLGVASLPKFANQSLQEIQRNVLSKIARIAFAGLLATIIYVLIAPFVFHLLFSRYVNAIHYTQIYAPIIALLAITNVSQGILTAKRMVREIYIVGILQPILLVCVQIPMLFAFGILGMLLARMISDAIGILLTLFLLLTKKESSEVPI
jgi:O-antigen/teichoic acid export membrane protein